MGLARRVSLLHHRIVTAEILVQFREDHWNEVALGQVFLKALRLPLPVIILMRGWLNRAIGILNTITLRFVLILKFALQI
jgi:hypothetical protein